MVPGTTLAYNEVFIYARASGYLSKRYVDIGDRVHAGQLMAMIDAPDLDRQVDQAKSTLRQSESNLNQMEAQLHLATVTWDRWKVLVAKGVFSRQDGDTQEANFQVAQANVGAYQDTVKANQANVDRLIVLQKYERVTAPFDGVVTARNVDVGALITAQGSGAGSSSTDMGGTQVPALSNSGGTQGTPGTAATPTTGGAQGGEMFHVARIDPIRVLVSAPEGYADAIAPGQRAAVRFPSIANPCEGRVTRTSASIDQNTRTLLVEVQIPNHSGKLMPGMYSQVNFVDARSEHPLNVPGESIVVRDGKTVVAKLSGKTVHFQPVVIGRDYGNKTEVTSGLAPGDVIAVNVSDDVREGSEVEPQFRSEAPASSNGQNGGNAPGKGNGGSRDGSAAQK
jgi:multidrug efflux pump subunit AcrA (membrane-fusion protein)